LEPEDGGNIPPNGNEVTFQSIALFIVIFPTYHKVVRVLDYRSRDLGSIPGATRFSET
jgi:hypothetical protein